MNKIKFYERLLLKIMLKVLNDNFWLNFMTWFTRFGLLVTALCCLVFLFSSSNSISRYLPLILLEVASSFLVGFFLFKNVKAQKNCHKIRPVEHVNVFLVASAFLLALADLIFGVDYYVLGFPTQDTLWFLLYHIPYSLWIIFLGIGCIKYARLKVGTNLETMFIVLVGSLFFIIQKKLILDFTFPLGFFRHEIRTVSSYGYAIFQSFTFPVLLLCSMLTNSRALLLYFCSGLGLIACDFGLRLQDVAYYTNSYPIFESVWGLLTYIGLIASIRLSARDNQESSKFDISESASIRFLVPFIGFVLGVATLVVLFSLNVLVVKSSFVLASLLLVLFMSWYALNLWSLNLSSLFLNAQIKKERYSSSVYKLSELEKIMSTQEFLQLEIFQLKQNLKHWLHDIRSPLLALDVSAGKLNLINNLENQEPKELLGLAVNRIKGMVPQIDRMATGKLTSTGDEVKSQVNIRDLIESLIKEKLSFKGVLGVSSISVDCNRAVFIKLNREQVVQLSRTLSNLLNNAIEAHVAEQEVSVSVLVETKIGLNSSFGNFISISIVDRGQGMPLEILKNLGKLGFTFSKSNGNGLGISHAKKFAADMGGKLTYCSELGVGTKAELMLPLSP